MQRRDMRAELASLYAAKATAPQLIEVPSLPVIALDGVGDPATSTGFQRAIEALMSIAWGIRARRKAQDPPVTIKVMPLEGVWSLPGIPFSEDPAVRAQLEWSLQIVQPEDVTPGELDAVREVVRNRKPALEPVADVRLEWTPAGPVGVMPHVGPFTTEPETIARIHEAIIADGGEPVLGHREIYLSDFRRVAPKKRKTILCVRRQ